MKLGVYGGTFDPIHNGHLHVAERLSTRFTFDRLLLIPAGVPPHKRNRSITDAYHRYAMTALATEGRPGWVPSTLEIEDDAPDYTVDTVARLHRLFPQSEPLYFIMGADSFDDLPSWREYLRLIESCHIIVTARPGYDLDDSHLPEHVRRRIVDLRDDDISAGVTRTSEYHTSIFLTDDAFIDISSTAVRDRARAGHPLDGVVPAAVGEYISKQELYKQT